jgi:hypothetical protein
VLHNQAARIDDMTMHITSSEAASDLRRAAASSNKYFYRYQPPTPAKDLLAEFWKLEKEAEKMLEGLAK